MSKTELVFYHPTDPSRHSYFCVEQVGTVITTRTAPLAQKDDPKKGTRNTIDMEHQESADAAFLAQIAFRKKRGFVEGGKPPKAAAPKEEPPPAKKPRKATTAASGKAGASTEKPARAKRRPREEWMRAPVRGGGFAGLSLTQRSSFETRAELASYEAPLAWRSIDGDKDVTKQLAALPATTRALRTKALTAKQLASVARLKKLEMLSFELESAAAGDADVLAPLRSLEELRYLRIPGLPRGRLGALLPSKGLRWLSLSGSDSIVDQDLAAASAIEALDVEHTPGVGEKALAALPNLRALRLGTTWSPPGEHARRVTDEALAVVGKMTRLRYLSIGNASRITEDGVASLASLDLDVLDQRTWGKLGAAAPRSKAYASFLASQTELRELYIECDGRLPPAALGAISKLTRLHTLMLPLAAEDATAFVAAVVKNAALVRVDLTIFGREGLDDLGAALTDLDRPESVSVGFLEVPKADATKIMAAFAKRHPRCELIVTGD